ncbi:group III truncated hemoglobin [Luteimonas sp. FCS-9]|uniref:group III truncated hemoglobin n=1 Tax=Luteimonas sp. FCS-9 TaxID=1547516 RepID=UPI00063EC7FC|nr:group III truncated hemoglobin [Luteimonas sp. FCS-9]KLJ01089.1 preprotein translocase subunit TatC [Luteimonas sp. FCS-9]
MSRSPASASPATATACCSEDEVIALVHRFYARVRKDPLLGPVFARHVHDWDAHLARLVDFWSAVLRGTRRFSGAPMPRHMALPGLRPALFERWLTLFRQTTAALGNPALQAEADLRAAAIAERFWQQYRIEGRDRPTPAPSDPGERA